MNRVVNGKHFGKKVIVAGLGILIQTGWIRSTQLTSKNVKSYEIINADSSNSMAGAMVRSAVGGAVLGAAGMLAGAVASNTAYLVRIVWQDGETSIIETNGNGIKALALELNQGGIYASVRT